MAEADPGSCAPETQARDLLRRAMAGAEAPDPVDLQQLARRLSDLDVSALPVLSPSGLQNQFNALTRHLSECQNIVTDLQTRTMHAKKRARTIQMALRLATRFLFKEDPEVKAGRSLVDREATAMVKLREEWIQQQHAQQEVDNFGAALVMAQDRLRLLKDRRATLRDQKDLLEAELYIGGGMKGEGEGPGSRSHLSSSLRPTGPYAADPDKVLEGVVDPRSAPLSATPEDLRQIRARSSVSS